MRYHHHHHHHHHNQTLYYRNGKLSNCSYCYNIALITKTLSIAGGVIQCTKIFIS